MLKKILIIGSIIIVFLVILELLVIIVEQDKAAQHIHQKFKICKEQNNILRNIYNNKITTKDELINMFKNNNIIFSNYENELLYERLQFVIENDTIKNINEKKIKIKKQ